MKLTEALDKYLTSTPDNGYTDYFENVAYSFTDKF